MIETQVAVVGGGPAGLAAAIAAAEQGAATMLLDEGRALGGQLRYRITEVLDGTGTKVRPAALATVLGDRAKAAGVQLRTDAVVWGGFAGNQLAIVEPDASYAVRADRLVLATGSTDRPLPFRGATSPGVITGRALQILLHVHRVRPGRRFAVLGGGAEAAEVAEDLRLADGEVVVFDPRGDPSRVTAHGADGVRSVTLDGISHEVETIVIAMGRHPDTQLALMIGCAAGYVEAFGGFVAIRDDCLRTNIPEILVAGDAAGPGDVRTALAEGTLAGISAAVTLGLGNASALAAAQDALRVIAPERLVALKDALPTYVQG